MAHLESEADQAHDYAGRYLLESMDWAAKYEAEARAHAATQAELSRERAARKALEAQIAALLGRRAA